MSDDELLHARFRFRQEDVTGKLSSTSASLHHS
jgi:hypothetical protein